MKFILVSDFHLLSKTPVSREDNLVETQFDKLRFILGVAKEEGAVILQAGDFCDAPRSWYLLPELTDILKEYGVPIYCVFGQHDTYMYNEETRGRTTLGVLQKAGLLTVLDPVIPIVLNNPVGGDSDISVYGASFGTNLGRVPSKGFTVGVAHVSVSDRPLYPNHVYTDAKKYLDQNPEYDLILVADCHRRFEASDEKGRVLINTGPILRKEANEYNLTHMPKVVLFDTEKPMYKWIDVPAEAPQLVLNRDHLERASESKSMLDEFVQNIKDQQEKIGSQEYRGTFLDNLWKFTQENEVEKEALTILAKITEKKNMEVL